MLVFLIAIVCIALVAYAMGEQSDSEYEEESSQGGDDAVDLNIDKPSTEESAPIDKPSTEESAPVDKRGTESQYKGNEVWSPSKNDYISQELANEMNERERINECAEAPKSKHFDCNKGYDQTSKYTWNNGCGWCSYQIEKGLGGGMCKAKSYCRECCSKCEIGIRRCVNSDTKEYSKYEKFWDS